jgi:hypothetical protein
MNDNAKTRLFYSEAKIYLDYEVSILSEILNLIRNETGTLAAEMLREYEHKLIEARRLEEDRSAREQDRRNQDIERRSDD